ncbi:MAG: EAL domain-containing protein [Actinomycetota bacterium]|nr:EAL domain-containing protein [Actinomycetota bacterium]
MTPRLPVFHVGVSPPGSDLPEDGCRPLFDAIPKPMWVFDARTLRFLEVNSAALTHYGYSRDEFLAMTIADIRPHDDVEALLRCLSEGEQGVCHDGGVWRHRRKDGSIIEVHITSSALTVAGRAARLVVAEDVTEQRRADAEREGEQRFRSVFAHAPVAAATVSGEGRFLQVNAALCELTGYSETELLSRTLTLIAHPDDVAAAAQTVMQVLGDHHARAHVELRLVRRDARVVAVLVAASAVHGGSGQAQYVIVALQDITERKAAEDRLAHRALHDSLTGLPNRELFVDRLDQALRRLERRDACLAVLFVDLDRFKLVNDSLGHAAGDQVLVAVAARLRAVLRPHDTIARFGGDEFTILCEDLTEQEAVHDIARRILDAVAAAESVDGQKVFLSASVGVAVSASGDVAGEVLLRDADSAMYRAKERGRNRHEVFNQVLRARTVARLEKANDLRRALGDRELRVFYQPVVRLNDEAVEQVEALVRWQHPELGLVGPREFIDVAEESGLVVPLGAWVLEEACRQLIAFQTPPGHTPLELAVNLSARQLAVGEVIDSVSGVLTDTGLEPSRLCLEITENVLMEDVESSIEALLGLKALGVRLAIDDFGTGYSSLSYLRRFPVDVVKIDRSFVTGVGVDPAAEAIVVAVNNLSHALGLTVVAEGVETREQLVALRALGCDRAQGYYWSPPVTAQELARWQRAPRPATVAPTPVDLRGLVLQRTAALRTRTGRSVLVDVPAGLPSAFADVGAVKNVLDHLLGNAVQYSEADRPVVVTADFNRRWVRVSIADYGIGMTAEQAARCFEQFWQAEVPDLRRAGGTGVGLYIVRSLVEAMGGRVGVKSALGKGSTFTVALPRSSRAVSRSRIPVGATPSLGEDSSIREFMRQLGVPTRSGS